MTENLSRTVRHVTLWRKDAWKSIRLPVNDLKYHETSEIVPKCSEVTEIVFRVIENNLKLRLTARKCVKPTGIDEKNTSGGRSRPESGRVRDLDPDRVQNSIAYAT